MVTSAIAGTSIVPVSSRHQTSFSSLLSSRSLRKNVVSVLRSPYSDSSDIGFSSKKLGIPLKFNEYESGAHTNSSYGVIVAKEGANPPTCLSHVLVEAQMLWDCSMSLLMMKMLG